MKVKNYIFQKKERGKDCKESAAPKNTALPNTELRARCPCVLVLQGPLMLEMGVLPEVAAATSATMVRRLCTRFLAAWDCLARLVHAPVAARCRILVPLASFPPLLPLPALMQIFFTSASASVVFISFGAVQWDYAAALFALGLVCTAAGQLLVLWVNSHLRSRSLLVVIMASVLGISAVVLAAQGVHVTRAAWQAGTQWAWHDICGRAAQ